MRHADCRALTPLLVLLLLPLSACSPAPAPDQTNFATPDEAARALMMALRTNDKGALEAIFGPNAEQDFSSGDPVSDRNDRAAIALAMEQSFRWDPLGDDRMELILGDEEWPLPVPLAQVRGGWQFDTAAGVDEMLSRRIGRNELRAIDVCRHLVAMQEEYASQPRDGKAAGLYAQRFLSTPGRQDGLYWRVGGAEPPSPLGDLVAQAVVEGYDETNDSPQPLWGYNFRVLTAQGAAAEGGAKSYIVDGEMSGGFALVAYPADYDQGGIMTFLVNQDGVVHQTDLGENTLEVAAGLEAYDPDASWTEVTEP